MISTLKKQEKQRYVFITGGVLSSLGKGIIASTIGALFEGMGYTVSFLKLDPYLNVDPGTMSPLQHGEVFVTQDGAETDLDLGNYERFTHVALTRRNSTTAGKIYTQLLAKERAGVFLGATIQTVPHLTDEIKESIYQAHADADALIVEVGGTIGDIEGLPFIEAIRQIHSENKAAECVYVHVTYVPFLKAAQELKTKPTQHSVKELRSLGIQPTVIIGRAEQELPQSVGKKIALFTDVDEHAVFSAPDFQTVYAAPVYFKNARLDKALADYLNLPYRQPDLTAWEHFSTVLSGLKDSVTIAIVGKYLEVKDAYKSVHEAITHAQVSAETRVHIAWIDAEALTHDNVAQKLHDAHGILVPGGFGERGIEGKITAARYAREHGIPYFGICLGMQVALIEFARNVLKMTDAHSTEFDAQTPYPVVALMPDQQGVIKGGTMRLGNYPCTLKTGTQAFDIYKADVIHERHRHRYEFNPAYVPQFEKAGMIVSGVYREKNLPEIIELKSHPFFVACQFHPEFTSKPFKPHPLFTAFIKAAHTYRTSRATPD